MAETKLYSFIDLFKDVSKIEIPIIQRDYAQGRKTPEVNKIRSRFLETIEKALSFKTPLKLDFVYGDIDDAGVLTPLDGQQRLTTLFLLHWYIGRHENVIDEKLEFLKKFSYATRYSAREFCQRLVVYSPNFELEKLSDDIVDQSWMPLDWQNDPTIKAMLNMLDDIHQSFKVSSNLWSCLEQGIVGFYFLSVKEMGLTDELYIKMNSRGKPLTEFEHFKAEWENALRKFDVEASKRIGNKIDLFWTDILWPYKGDNNIIDDEFIRYFKYVSSLLYYKNYQEKNIPTDVFDIVRDLFADNENDSKENLDFIESSFDCWTGLDIKPFFANYLTQTGHEKGKSLISESVDLFEDCCCCYGERKSARIRSFSIGRMILLYAFLLYLRNKNVVSDTQFRRRLRIVNNLVKASEFELREDRMHSLLEQVDEIILEERIEIIPNRNTFNSFQVQEEVEKKIWLVNNSAQEEELFRLEDHPILNGGISVVGLDNVGLTDEFYSLFDCDKKLINRAMLTIGDYSLKVNWRYQIGSANMIPWKTIFHTDSENIQKVKSILIDLIHRLDEKGNDSLIRIIDNYLNTVNQYDWRYYLIKYKEMRPERHGMYFWYNADTTGKKSYKILMMMTEKSLSGKNYNIFLKTLYEMSSHKSQLRLGDYAYRGEGDKLYIDKVGVYITSEDSCLNVVNTQTGDIVKTVKIPQNNDVDCTDRIEVGLTMIDELFR